MDRRIKKDKTDMKNLLLLTLTAALMWGFESLPHRFFGKTNAGKPSDTGSAMILPAYSRD